MSVYPHSHTFLGPTFTTVISGPHIQVLNTSTGDVLHTTAPTTAHQDAYGVLKAGPVRCAAVDRAGRHLATSGEDKQLRVWAVDGLRLLSERELPKRPTKVAFTKDGKTILVADKFGDIFGYPLAFTPPPAPAPAKPQTGRDALSSHENPSGGTLVLGHASLLTAFLLSPDERFIVTADRDEHIRVSWYPQGYNIERYCLGHTKFVSALHNPAFAPADLVSGGGDPALRIWDWMAGTVRHEIGVWDAVEPYVKVRSAKRRRGEDGEEPHEGTRRGKGKKAKGKGKGKAKAGEDANLPVAMEGQSAEASTSAEPQAEQPSTVPDSGAPVVDAGEKVLVIHKIETVASEAGNYILFSAVGATALFVCSYPNGTTTTDVRSFDLGQPVVDFVVSDDGLIWVSLNGNWSEEEAKISGPSSPLIRILKLSAGELSASSFDSPLLSSLNEKCRIEATASDLKKLDIYGDLTTMPKNTDAEQDQGSEAPVAEENVSSGKQVSKKELGRLKSKQAVLAKVQGGGSGGGNAGDEEVEEPESKKSRSERGDDTIEDGQDVQMAEATA